MLQLLSAAHCPHDVLSLSDMAMLRVIVMLTG
jgi:hypothetical protein